MNKEQPSRVLELLRQSSVEVASETFFLVSLAHKEWLKLLENPELSPRMTAPFMIFRDKWEVTLLLDDIDFGTIRYAIRDAKTQGNFRLLTFNTELDFGVIGFLAVALSAFSRDHILVSQQDLARALKVLGEYVGELC